MVCFLLDLDPNVYLNTIKQSARISLRAQQNAAKGNANYLFNNVLASTPVNQSRIVFEKHPKSFATNSTRFYINDTVPQDFRESQRTY